MVHLGLFQEAKCIQHLKNQLINHINQVGRKPCLLSSYIGVFFILTIKNNSKSIMIKFNTHVR